MVMKTPEDIRAEIDRAQQDKPLTTSRLAELLSRRAAELDAEAATMQESSQIQRRDQHGILRDRDSLRWLCWEYRVLVERLVTP